MVVEQNPNKKPTAPETAASGSAFGIVLEVIKIVAIALAIIIPVRYFLIQPFSVRGPSMEPTFFDGEYLIVDELSYDLPNHAPRRGEVVVFRFPGDQTQFYIKRIIGLPGETVEVKNGHVTIKNKDNPEGSVLDESAYLDASVVTTGNTVVTLGKDEYFVMGDNRTQSSDSRSFGAVERKLFVGRVGVRAWPFDRATTFHAPSYSTN